MLAKKIDPWVICTECNAPITIQAQYIVDFLRNQSVTCPRCNKNINWWNVVLNVIKDNFMLYHAFAPIGAQSTAFKVKLKLGERAHFKFSDHGIPVDASILYVNSTPEGNEGGFLFPLDAHHGNVTTTYRFMKDEVTVFPLPFGNVKPDKEYTASVFVTWIPKTADDESWANLVNAFVAYANDQYEAAIVPANIAMESALSKFLDGYLSRFAGKERVENFLDNAATYSHQLNVMIPLLTSLVQLTKLPDDIRGLLNRLRDYRNQMVHSGKLDKLLSKDDVADVLCAALFGFRYIQLLQSEVPPASSP